MTRTVTTIIVCNIIAASSAWSQNEPAADTMMVYQVAFLKRGPNWTPQSTPESQKMQQAHMAHISAMAKTGKLILAGPFADSGPLRGMFVFKATADEAKELAEQDPTVKAGRLVLEWHPWYSSKGIGIVTEPKGEKKK
jgi:uncharacterized protein